MTIKRTLRKPWVFLFMEINLKRLGGCFNDKTVCVFPRTSSIVSFGLCFSFWLIDLILIFKILIDLINFNFNFSTLDFNVLKNVLNNLHTAIKFTEEPAKFDEI